jgi:hypothetical protein
VSVLFLELLGFIVVVFVFGRFFVFFSSFSLCCYLRLNRWSLWLRFDHLLPLPKKRISLSRISLSWSIIRGLRWPATGRAGGQQASHQPEEDLLNGQDKGAEDFIQIVLEDTSVVSEVFPENTAFASRLIVSAKQLNVFDRVRLLSTRQFIYTRNVSLLLDDGLSNALCCTYLGAILKAQLFVD